ncbi:hypothetical protein ACJRO7_000771 [Eucalyptus globulus]|uniref:Uncharacterized protein n=1 Tax=Eucalyptus globulus TaxID=34317 RepID=A0ABD3LNR2_EUCGL
MAVLRRKLRRLVEKLGIGKKLAGKGCFVAYVGEEGERREIPVKCLDSVMLQALFNQCRDQSDERTGLYLCCSPEFLNWVLELAKSEVEETDHNLAIKNDRITHADMSPIWSSSNFFLAV